MTSGCTREPFGRLADGTEVEAVTLGAGSIRARIITFGAAIQSLWTPDAEGRMADIVLGYPDIGSYESRPQYFGATVGRYANRIAGGAFALDGKRYQLECNDGPNSLHGGSGGFFHRNWTVAETTGGPHPSVTLTRTSPDGEEGFPGRLDLRVRFTLSERGDLAIRYEATTDRPTIVNLTNHSYFNLAGVERLGDILGHRLTVEADAFLPVDETAIPTGEVRRVDGSAFDFRTLRPFGEGVRNAGDEQIARGRGYDHNFVLRGGVTAEPKLAARVEEPVSGRTLELWTTEPGLQVYSGNFLDGTSIGKHRQLQRQGDGFCLEPQHFPDSPNRREFPSVRLEPGETYRQASFFRFSTRER